MDERRQTYLVGPFFEPKRKKGKNNLEQWEGQVEVGVIRTTSTKPPANECPRTLSRKEKQGKCDSGNKGGTRCGRVVPRGEGGVKRTRQARYDAGGVKQGPATNKRRSVSGQQTLKAKKSPKQGGRKREPKTSYRVSTRTLKEQGRGQNKDCDGTSRRIKRICLGSKTYKNQADRQRPRKGLYANRGA